MRQLTLGVQLKERATFASFLTARNVELVAHLRHVAANTPAGATWIAGPHTAGKSHLLAGGLRGYPGGQARRLSSARDAAAFRARRRSKERISSTWRVTTTCRRSPAWMTGNAACSRCGKARTSAAPRCCSRRARIPRTSTFGLPDLKSRLASSAVFAVRELNDEEQIEALNLRAHLRGFELPAETARYLQRRFPRDMRTLCEILDTLDDASFAAQRRLTVPFIRGIIDAPRSS